MAGTAEDVRAALRDFVRAYAGAPSGNAAAEAEILRTGLDPAGHDAIEVRLFGAWLAACDALGIVPRRPPTDEQRGDEQT